MGSGNNVNRINYEFLARCIVVNLGLGRKPHLQHLSSLANSTPCEPQPALFVNVVIEFEWTHILSVKSSSSFLQEVLVLTLKNHLFIENKNCG